MHFASYTGHEHSYSANVRHFRLDCWDRPSIVAFKQSSLAQVAVAKPSPEQLFMSCLYEPTWFARVWQLAESCMAMNDFGDGFLIEYAMILESTLSMCLHTVQVVRYIST